MKPGFGPLIAVSLAVIAGSGAQARGEEHTKPVALYISAEDRAGHAVTDLRATDLRLFDDGVRQDILAVRSETPQPASLAIVFDFTDLRFAERAVTVEQLRSATGTIPADAPLYVYFLLDSGKVQPVYRLPGVEAANLTGVESASNSWSARAGPLLEAALRQQTDARPLRDEPTRRYNALSAALELMDREMSRAAGRRQLLFVTHGIPTDIEIAGRGAVDVTARLLELAAELNQDNVTIYGMDPSPSGGGIAAQMQSSPVVANAPRLVSPALNSGGISVLSDATGGAVFSGVKMAAALARIGADARSACIVEYRPSSPVESKHNYHTVRVSCVRKGVRIRSQTVYFPRLEILR